MSLMVSLRRRIDPAPEPVVVLQPDKEDVLRIVPDIDHQPAMGHVLDKQIADKENDMVARHIKCVGRRDIPVPPGIEAQQHPPGQGGDCCNTSDIDDQFRHRQNLEFEAEKFRRRLPRPMQNPPQWR